MTPRLTVRAVSQKEALHRQLRENARPRKDVADAVEVAVGTLSQWADVTVDSHIPSSRIPALLMASSSTALLDYWASLQGRVVVELPRPHKAETMACQLTELCSAFAAVLIHHSEATDDGMWTRAEVETMRPLATRLAALSLAQLAFAESQVPA